MVARRIVKTTTALKRGGVAHPALSDGKAKYIQIYDRLKEAIASGELAEGSRLRPEREMIEEFGVSRNTIRQALGALEQEGLLRREPGLGTFIRSVPVPLSPGQGETSREIGVFLAKLDADFQAHLLQGIDEVLSAAGLRMTVSLYRSDEGEEARRMQDLLSTGLAGMIVFPSCQSAGNFIYPKMAEKLPLVFVDNPVQGTCADVVLMDDAGTAYAGARELLARGCRRIAYLGGYFSAWTSRERYSGFHRALSEAGVQVDPSLVFEGPFTHDFGFRTLGQVLDSGKEVDGLFIANHPITEGVVRAMLVRDKSLLDRIDICSFGDEGFGSHYLLPIIVARQPVADMGRYAARRMLELVDARRRGLPRPQPKTIIVEKSISLPEDTDRAADSPFIQAPAK